MTISDFYLAYGVALHATITLGAGSASAEMTGNDANGVSWMTINGGIAFLNVIPGDGASLRIETWGTDTNGNYTAAAIDIFTVPIDVTKPFPATLANLRVASLHCNWTYVITPIPGNPNGFNLDAGGPVPPSNARVGNSVN